MKSSLPAGPAVHSPPHECVPAGQAQPQPAVRLTWHTSVGQVRSSSSSSSSTAYLYSLCSNRNCMCRVCPARQIASVTCCQTATITVREAATTGSAAHGCCTSPVVPLVGLWHHLVLLTPPACPAAVCVCPLTRRPGVGFTITQWGRNVLKHNLTATERYNITVSSSSGSSSCCTCVRYSAALLSNLCGSAAGPASHAASPLSPCCRCTLITHGMRWCTAAGDGWLTQTSPRQRAGLGEGSGHKQVATGRRCS
jgi:hypothetical protein